MNSNSEITKIDYVVRKVAKQVYNVFPFVGIKCEPNFSWNSNDYDIVVQWYYKGNGHVFKHTIADDLLDHIADLDYIVCSFVHRICDEIMKTCNDSDEEEVTNDSR